VTSGQEYFIPKRLVHAGEFIAGTRTINAFGGEGQKERVILNNLYLPLKYSAARFEISACF
jgi:hypothetical protein